MLDDLRKTRDFVSNIWSDFVDKADDRFLDPAAVAIATNTGIDFARNLIDDMLPVFKDHGGVLPFFLPPVLAFPFGRPLAFGCFCGGGAFEIRSVGYPHALAVEASHDATELVSFLYS